MHRGARALAVMAAVAMAFPAGALAGVAAADGDGAGAQRAESVATQAALLLMKAGSFDPASDSVPGPQALRAPLLPSAADTASDGRVRFILQFDGGVDPALIEGLRPRGITYERYLPDRGMIASALPRDVPVHAADVGARAMLALHPALKLAPELWSAAETGTGSTLRIAALVFTGPEAGPTLARAGTLLAFDGRMAILDILPARLLPLARNGDIEWLDPYTAPTPMNDILTRTIGARQAADGPFEPLTGSAVWSYNNATHSFEGVDGSGVTINIADTGVDSTHPTFAGRIVGSFGYGDNATCDCTPNSYPHGTHVAGIAAGDGAWRENDTGRQEAKYAGVAPNASIVAQMIFNSIRTPAQYSQDAFSAGAFVNSNSWAATGGGTYTSLAEEYDALVTDANGRDAGTPQMVYSFSSGNSGRYGDTGAPSNGKNVISVGATGNGRWSATDQVAGFSSRGPASDGRVKPDVVAPGEGVDSARAQIAGCGGGEDNCSYWLASGTSMSAPAVSGAAALVTQAFRIAHGVSPSAAMVKGLLIAGAKPLPNIAWPGPEQGWGLIQVARSVDDLPGFTHIVWDEGPALAQVSGRTDWSARVFAQGGGELRFVLQWSDVAGTTSSAKALINDLDLEVRAPDGTLYLGNQIHDAYTASGGSADRGNNTEVVRIQWAARGTWTITVRASAVPAGDQRFAMIAVGDITDHWVSLAPRGIEFLPAAPHEDDPLAVIVPIVNDGTAYAPGFTVTAQFEGPEGIELQEANVLSVRPGDDFPATFTFYPKRGTHSLSVAVDIAGVSGDTTDTDNTAGAEVFVSGFEPSLQVARPIPSLAPLTTDTFLIEVGNGGNVPDIMALGASTSSGWSVALNATTVLIEPGTTRLIAGTLTAPERALAGQVAQVHIHVASTGNGSRVADATMEVAAAQSLALRLGQGLQSATASPGETVALPYSVENAGNFPVHIHIRAAFAVPAPAGFELSPADFAFDLAAYSSAAGNVSATVPPNAVAASYRAAVVSIWSDQEGVTTDLTYQLAVRRVGGFTLAGAPPSQSGPPGSTLEFPIEVRNTGNARETFTVAALPAQSGAPRVQYNVENSTLVVAPFSTGYATVQAYVLRSAAAGAFNGVVEVSPATGVALTTAVVGVVEAVHDLVVDAPERGSVRASSSTALTATIENAGNSPEDIAFVVTSLPDGLTISGWSATATVQPGADLNVVVRVNAAATAAPGVYDLQLELRPTAGTPFPPQELTIQVEVRAAASSAASSTPGPSAAAAALALGVVAIVAWRRRN